MRLRCNKRPNSSFDARPRIRQCFSAADSEYTRSTGFAGKRVLVVGFGNSGAEIAIDLHEWGAKPAVAIRGPVNVLPREILGIPVLTWPIALSPLPDRVQEPLPPR